MGRLECDASEVIGFKKIGGDRRMGGKNPCIHTHRRSRGHASKGKKNAVEPTEALNSGC